MERKKTYLVNAFLEERRNKRLNEAYREDDYKHDPILDPPRPESK